MKLWGGKRSFPPFSFPHSITVSLISVMYYICMTNSLRLRGFSFIELMVVIAVVALLATVAVVSLSAMQERLLLNSARSNVAFHLEEMRAKAVAGSGGVSHGVNFSRDRYVQFQGGSYSAIDSQNSVHVIDDRLEIVTDIIGNSKSIVFDRITGTTGSRVAVTIRSRMNPENQQVVVVGTGGDISYGE